MSHVVGATELRQGHRGRYLPSDGGIAQFGGGVTFPLGYTDGTQAYLPASRMLPEGGYEVESFWEYRHTARLAKGIEQVLQKGIEELKAEGIR